MSLRKAAVCNGWIFVVDNIIGIEEDKTKHADFRQLIRLVRRHTKTGRYSMTLTIRSIEQLDAENTKRPDVWFTQGWTNIARGELACEITRIPQIRSSISKCLPRITLYSSASRRSSITSAVGNGLTSDLPDTLLSDIRTVLPDLLPLQIINFVCNDHVIVMLSTRYHRVFTPIGVVVDAFFYYFSYATFSLTRVSNLFTR